MGEFLRRLRGGGSLVGDGAWGTLLMERGLRPGECPESFNLTHPEVLAEIGHAYLDAGAEVLTANSFGGSPLKLRSHGLEGDTAEINRRAVLVLREIASGRAWIVASVGPTGAILRPYGETEEDEVYGAFERQIESLADAGADAICIETMIDLREAVLAIRAARNVAPELPVLATMTFDRTPRGFFTIMGNSLEQAAAGLGDAGADAIGSNCGNGSETMVEIAGQLRRCSSLPLVIQPNAGLPENRAGEVVYPESPEFMAEQARLLIEQGVTLIGGCCGTSPAHVRAIRDLVGSGSPGGDEGVRLDPGLPRE